MFYRKTPQFRQVVKDHNGLIMFKGTVKLDGTNAGVFIDKNGNVSSILSRTRKINKENDNFGFAAFIENQDLSQLFPKDCTVFGEWVGAGIQKGSGIEKLNQRVWVVFCVRYSDGSYNYDMQFPETGRILNINSFPTYHVSIDLANPNVKPLEQLVKLVEENCPVAGKLTGLPKLVGEGIVWHSVNTEQAIIFKTKGEKHKVQNTKRVVELTPEELDKRDKVLSFINYAVTNNRLKQADTEVGTDDIGNFIKCILNDILTEEKDVMDKNSLVKRDISKAVAIAAKKYLNM